MNDSELDEILKTWTAPPVPDSLRRRVRAGLPEPPRRRTKWIVAAVLAAAALLLIATQAFPQNRGAVPAAWTVDSQFIRYADDGSSSIEMYSTSYSLNGNEIIWSRSMPGNPFRTVLGLAVDVAVPIHDRFLAPVMLNAQQMERRKRALASSVGFITGCSGGCLILDHFYFRKAVPTATTGCIEGTIAGRETILSYPTAAFRERWTEHGRMTLWVAPDLACFALKVTYEEERSDGSFRLVAAKQAVKVNLNP